ncbi:hypothetical protein niasHT_030681 [Heterodera trifolii]|uniref:C-CAP/cofactor C-like domain-containing protein n=1 Tax=Heterodera trifolii TaxID=157864 RepID=A0ABD2HSU0_9BILA
MFTFSQKPEKRPKKDDGNENNDTFEHNTQSNSFVGAAISALQLSAKDVDTTFKGIVEQTVCRGSADGNPFAIRECTGSVLVLLGHAATITIDKCSNCVIICGPCRGSIFMRNCANCLLLAACHQFRLQNSRDIEAHLHCSTKPTIEDSDLIVAPLLMRYDGFKGDMESARLDNAANLWDKVQNFTPETGQFQQMNFDPFANGAISSEVIGDELLEKLSTFMEEPEAQELSLGPS